MAKFTLTVRENAKFDRYDAARVLNRLARGESVTDGECGRLYDAQGNRIGEWRYEAAGDQVEVAAVEAEPWRVRLTYHVTQYRWAEVEIPRGAASGEQSAAASAMAIVRNNPSLLATEEAEDVLCCDVEVDGASWRDESGDFGI